MTCKNNCKDIDDEDGYEIQRLQDIIKICEFLIKHKRNQKHRDTLDKMLDDLTNPKDQEDKDDDNYTTRVVYQPIYPNWYWNQRKYPWYDIWS